MPAVPFPSRRGITLGIYRRVPVLIDETKEDGNPWGVSFMAMFHMANDSHLFRTREDLESAGWRLNGNVFTKADARMLPLYEAKMLHHYDHRLGTYEGQTEAQAKMGTLPRVTPEQHDDPGFVSLPRYRVPDEDIPTGRFDKNGDEVMEAGIASRLADRGWQSGWLLGWRDICRATDERTVINSVLPRSGLGHTYPLILVEQQHPVSGLVAAMSSLVFDYAARQKIGGTHLTYTYINQLPVETPQALMQHREFIQPRVLELAYSATDMQSFALYLGDSGAPFRWDAARREVIRAELDALFFHLYGGPRMPTTFSRSSPSSAVGTRPPTGRTGPRS